MGSRPPDETVASWLAGLEGRAALEVPPAAGARRKGAKRGEGPFKLGPEIGRGGAGLVRVVYDAGIGRAIALKTPIAGTNADEREIGRFLAEARVTGQLDHPAIVPVHELGRLPDGPLYYTMKLVQGRTLHDVFSALRGGDEQVRGEFGRVRLLNVFLQMCAGVGYAHSRGVVHRDLKPENVMLGAHGEVYVLDWGLAKVRGEAIHRSDEEAVRTADGQVIGTPSYMAPEQALGKVREIDPRADVYSLGAILYEMLTLAPPFGGDSALDVLIKVAHWSLVPPRQRAPGEDIPEELDEICVRALAKDPGGRYPSASELRRNVEAFLEGARSRQEADEHAARGAAEVERYLQARQDTSRLWNEARVASGPLRPFDPVEIKRPVWELERLARQAEADAARAFAQAATTFERALTLAPSHRAARRQLAELYYRRFEEAEARRDLDAAVYFRTQVEAYDDGAHEQRLRDEAVLSIRCETADVEILAARYVDELGVLRLEAPTSLGRAPVERLTLPMGSYLLLLCARGRLEARYPVSLGRGQSLEASVRLLAPSEIEEGMVYVPGGPFLFGGDAQAPTALEASFPMVGDFAIARLPVTQGEYREFINDLARRDADGARRRVPRTETEHRPHWLEEGGGWRIPEVDGDGDPWDERHPVMGVSYEDAEAYCRWLSERTDRATRLPTEEEWEKAARGVDGRIFPWGDRFDATFCKMRDSKPGHVRLEVVGTYDQDESPYGVRDMAGGVREWVSSTHLADPLLRVVRGGGAGASPLTCRIGYRSWHQSTDVTSYFGFRIARSV